MRRRPFVIAFLFLALGVAALATYALRQRNFESTDDAQIESDVVVVSVRVPGIVATVSALDNHPIKKGELIAQIDDADCAAHLKQAEAELAQARAQAAGAEMQEDIVAANARGGIAAAQALVAGSGFAVRGASADSASARAAVQRAEADVKSAELDRQRIEALHAENVVSRSKLDDAQTAAERAQATLAQTRATLAAAEEQQSAVSAKVTEARGRLVQSAPLETQLGAARADTAFHRARVTAAEAAVALARSQLDATRIVAPSDGLLTNLSLHAGVLAAVGTPVAIVVPPETYVIANFKETQLGEMHPGQAVRVSVDAFSRQVFDGEIETIAGGTQGRFSLLPADNASGNFVKVVQRVPVRIRLRRHDAALLPGLSADVTVTVR